MNPPVENLLVTLADTVGFEVMSASTTSPLASSAVFPEDGHVYFTPLLQGNPGPIIEKPRASDPVDTAP